MDEVPQSLIDRATERLSPGVPARPARVRREVDWRFAAALAALIALAPLATIVGASMLEREARTATEQLRAQIAPRLEAAASDRRAHSVMAAAVRSPTLAEWLDRLAAALPADARLARMTKSTDGGIEADVLVPDPDSLRSALRRDPGLAFLRERAQRRSDAMTLVTLRGRP